MKLRKDLGNEVSSSSKIVIESIKEKIDDQARILEEEERNLKDQCDYYRRKEEKLRLIKQKTDIVQGRDRFENDIDEDRKSALMKEIQIDYNKYLKLYKDSVKGYREKTQLRNQDLQAFQDKWADYLHEEANEDLRPLIGLDPGREFFKPRSLYRKYEMSDQKYKSQLAVNHIYDRELR